MFITARFASVCPKCSGRITEGSNVEWSKGSKATHASCPTAKPVAAKTVAARAIKAEFTAHEKWEPCRRAALPSAVGESRRYTSASSSRPAGSYVVVSQSAHYQSADDADDFGDCDGAGWVVTLGLRAATAEETAADDARRLGAAMAGIGSAIAGMCARMAERSAREQMDSLVESGECVRVDLWAYPVVAQKAERVWEGNKGRDWIVRRTLEDGRIVMVSSRYIYDWDQPFVVVAPADVIAALAVVEAASHLARTAPRAQMAVAS